LHQFHAAFLKRVEHSRIQDLSDLSGNELPKDNMASAQLMIISSSPCYTINLSLSIECRSV
jgi:hypothetical protein